MSRKTIMDDGFNHHHRHRHRHGQKTIFLPKFCRLSIKDIKLNYRRNDPRLSDEPSSPKVSCMGQVKRNNRIIGFPAASSAAPVATHHHKYSKLKKLFSSKTLMPPTTSSMPAAAASAGGRSGSKSCRSTSREERVRDLRRLKSKKDGDGNYAKGYVNDADIGELDPPLPVVKRAAPPGDGRDEVNLWRRRFNGAALKDLQIEQIHLRNSNSRLPTV